MDVHVLKRSGAFKNVVELSIFFVDKFDPIKRSGSRIHYSRSSSGYRMSPCIDHSSGATVRYPPRICKHCWHVYTMCTLRVHTVCVYTPAGAHTSTQVCTQPIGRIFYGPVVNRFADNSGLHSLQGDSPDSGDSSIQHTTCTRAAAY